MHLSVHTVIGLLEHRSLRFLSFTAAPVDTLKNTQQCNVLIHDLLDHFSPSPYNSLQDIILLSLCPLLGLGLDELFIASWLSPE